MKQIAIPDISLSAIGPEIVLVVTAIILLMLEVFATKKGKDNLAFVALAGVLIASAMIFKMTGPAWKTFSDTGLVNVLAPRAQTTQESLISRHAG